MRSKPLLKNTRLSHRIFLLFFFCVILPLAVIIAFSFFQLEDELKTMSYRQLRQQTKSISLSVYERLLLVETEIKLYAALGPNPPANTGRPGGRLRDPFRQNRLENLCRFGPGGGRQLLGGDPGRCGAVPQELQTQGRDRSLIFKREHAGHHPRLFMAVPVGSEEWLVGEIDTDYLWSVDTDFNLPPGFQLCVTDQADQVLVASVTDTAPLVAELKAAARKESLWSFSWRKGGAEQWATAHHLFLASRFAADRWTIVLTQSNKSVLASIRDFEAVFALVGLLILLVALFLSSVSIRRSLAPLKKLTDSTKAFAAGDFSGRAPIQGSADLQDLADAFNRMTERIARQFRELSLLAALGQKLSSVRELPELCDALIDSIRRYFDYDRVLILLAEDPANAPSQLKGFNFSRDEIQEFGALFTGAKALVGRDPCAAAFVTKKAVIWEDPRGLGLFDDGQVPAFYRRIDTRSLVCVPIVHENKSLGILMLVATGAVRGVTDSERELLHGIAATAAVCVASIDSYSRLRQSEERFRKAFDHSAAGMALISPAGRFLQVNPYLCEMLGTTEGELLSQTVNEVTHPDDLQKTEEVGSGLLSDTIGAATFEKRFLCKDGRIAWALVSKSLLKDTAGAPLYFITHIQDITAQKEAQHESANLEGQLRHAQKMEAIGTLSAGIAHDFNNILSAIMGYTELALLDSPPGHENTDRLDKVMRACNRAAGLIKQILAFSRHDEEKMESVQLSSVVKEALKLLRSTFPPQISIVQDISNAPYVVQADPTQVHQLVMNLCTNAYHAMMNRDSGTLTVSLQPEEAAGAAGGTMLKLMITDTGSGMSPEVRERIFEPYFTTKKKGLGTGLGLSIVHGIVKKHGGEIQVHSTLGEGTSFEIRLPASQQTGNSRAAAGQIMPSGKECILVVDDEKEITAIYREVLTRQGFHVEALNDPNEALDEFRQNPDRYHMVLTDMAMPGMSGEKLALEIGRIRPQVPIVLCTGYFDELQNKGLGTGFTDCLMKPVNLGLLMETVRRVIDQPSLGNGADFPRGKPAAEIPRAPAHGVGA